MKRIILFYTLLITALACGTCVYAEDECGHYLTSSATIYRIDPGSAYGVFSVTADKQVFLAQGNVEFYVSDMGNTASKDTLWRLTEHQAGKEGNTNATQGHSYNYWYDLMPKSLAIGKVHPISEFGNYYEAWHPLTKSEWQYLLARQDANGYPLHALAQVHVRLFDQQQGVYMFYDVNGLLLLPDFYKDNMTGLTIDRDATTFATNRFQEPEEGQVGAVNEWDLLEKAGCVFLPCAGTMTEEATSVWSWKQGDEGFYWVTGTGANVLHIGEAITGGAELTTQPETTPCSVRLALDVNNR